MTTGSSVSQNQALDRIKTFSVKVLVWLGLFGVLWTLRSFSLLIFLTFVFAYIQAHAVEKLAARIEWRTLRVVLVGVVFLGVVVGVISFLTPHVRDQSSALVQSLPQALRQFDDTIYEFREASPLLREVIPPAPRSEQGALLPWDVKRSRSAQIIESLMGIASSDDAAVSTKELIDRIKMVTGHGLALGSSFLLSLLFSFLIVLDLPELTRGVRRLRESRVAFVYEEVGHSIAEFARVLGRALSAQFYIAILNTILTAIGISLLGIGGSAAFLSVVVFFCSFIPVAGVFISSFPICLLAFQKGGVGLMFGAAVLIWIIHLIEAYILNPKIYGHALRVNPVLVLIILTLGGKLFGVWGLVLGLPVCTYIFGRAIWTDGEPSKAA
jgi:predicted PurR-regulated permease PerM